MNDLPWLQIAINKYLKITPNFAGLIYIHIKIPFYYFVTDSVIIMLNI